MLVDAAQKNGVDRLPETVTRVKIHSPEGEPLGPCHAGGETYVRLGVPPMVSTTAPEGAGPRRRFRQRPAGRRNGSMIRLGLAALPISYGPY